MVIMHKVMWRRKDLRSLEKLPYVIHSCSSTHGKFVPENILVNHPHDQNCCWCPSSLADAHVILRLQTPCVLHALSFGKYRRNSLRNAKDFKIYVTFELCGGNTRWTEVLESQLRNDEFEESFVVRHTVPDTSIVVPSVFIRITLLSTWGQNMLPSLWYVALFGDSDASTVSNSVMELRDYRENEAIRLCLKFLRQRNFGIAFSLLADQTGSKLEVPYLTELHRLLVGVGDFESCERLLCSDDKILEWFSSYITSQKCNVVWRRILNPNKPAPGMRGGHQMCVDRVRRRVYVLGGWNGKQDLSDFWYYDMNGREWYCISENTELDGGPSARSCHKICYDSTNGVLYTLGRYVDPENRDSDSMKSDFYAFDVSTNEWRMLSSSTVDEGGPPLIYDHQVGIDEKRGLIYVFGGRVLQVNTVALMQYSGLHRYNIGTGEWTLLFDDEMTSRGICVALRSRIGHSMLYHVGDGCLYILSGQRHREYMSDFYIYDTIKNVPYELSRNCHVLGGPEPGFTQRAIIDCDSEEIHVFSGLTRDRSARIDTVRNNFWIYRIREDKWELVYHNENTDPAYWTRMQMKEPCPRFAHQFVYDPVERKHYLFGGNAGELGLPEQRLDDFWEMELERPTLESVKRRVKFLIRKQEFYEMCAAGRCDEAVTFLQQNVHECINHSRKEEVEEFRSLSSLLFRGEQLNVNDNFFASRTEVFSQLLEFFPKEVKEPVKSIDEFV